jgi:hypothetical protein
MPGFAWALLGLLWLLVATLMLLPRVMSSRMPAKSGRSPVRTTESEDTALHGIAWLLGAIPAVLLILGQPASVVAFWLLTVLAVSYLVTLALHWRAARRR